MPKSKIILKPHKKASITAKWAKTMMKWAITYASNEKPWQVVSFEGPQGSESRGIVDLIAIRRNHRYKKSPLKAGDLFEIILIQVKGGGAAKPFGNDILRLLTVGKFYHVKYIVLAEWKKGKMRNFYLLKNRKWILTDPELLFN